MSTFEDFFSLAQEDFDTLVALKEDVAAAAAQEEAAQAAHDDALIAYRNKFDEVKNGGNLPKNLLEEADLVDLTKSEKSRATARAKELESSAGEFSFEETYSEED